MILTIVVNGPNNAKLYEISRRFNLPEQRQELLAFATTWGASLSYDLANDLCRLPLDLTLNVDYGSREGLQELLESDTASLDHMLGMLH
jgi:hypothetical protein